MLKPCKLCQDKDSNEKEIKERDKTIHDKAPAGFAGALTVVS